MSAEQHELTPAQIRSRIESKKLHKTEVIRYRDDDDYYDRNRKVYSDRITAAQHSLAIVEASRNNATNLLAMLDSDLSKLEQQLKLAESRETIRKMQEMQQQIANLTAALGNNVNTGPMQGSAIQLDLDGDGGAE